MRLRHIKPKQLRFIVNTMNIKSKLYYSLFDKFCELCDQPEDLTAEQKNEAHRLAIQAKKIAKKMLKKTFEDSDIDFWDNELKHKYN